MVNLKYVEHLDNSALLERLANSVLQVGDVDVGIDDPDNPKVVSIIMKCCRKGCNSAVFEVADTDLLEDTAVSLVHAAMILRKARGEEVC